MINPFHMIIVAIGMGMIGIPLLLIGLTKGDIFDLGLGVTLMVITIVLFQILKPDNNLNNSSLKDTKNSQ